TARWTAPTRAAYTAPGAAPMTAAASPWPATRTPLTADDDTAMTHPLLSGAAAPARAPLLRRASVPPVRGHGGTSTRAARAGCLGAAVGGSASQGGRMCRPFRRLQGAAEAAPLRQRAAGLTGGVGKRG